MRVAVTGATGTLGRVVVEALRMRGDDVTVLSRDAGRARATLGDVEAHAWSPGTETAPVAALAGRDGVVHLLGEPVAQRWTDVAKRRIRESRVAGTRNLVAGIEAAEPRPRVLVSQSATGYYGPRGDEPVTEAEPPGSDFLAEVVTAWEAEAARAAQMGVRVVVTRTGVVLSPGSGALEKMLPPFRLGVGGPLAGGRQFVPWIHEDDVSRALVHCLDDDAASGPVNVTAPRPVTNRELSKTLGRVLGRPAVAPVPALAVRLLYGEMASIVTTGVRAVPERLSELGFEWRRPELDDALRAAVSGSS